MDIGSILYTIFSICIDVLNKTFTIAGIKVSLMAFILFDVIAFLLLSFVISLFKK